MTCLKISLVAESILSMSAPSTGPPSLLEALDTASLASSSSSLQHRVRLTSSQWAGLCVDRV